MLNSSKTFGKLTTPLFLLLAISFSAVPVQAKYGGGTGEPNYPYLIYDANQMNAIGADQNDWDKCFKLMADIDLSGYNGAVFNIIGSQYNPFSGFFDGNGHTISNFTYDSNGVNYIGLFGFVNIRYWGALYGPLIKNLGLIDPHVDAGTGDYVGSLLGYLYEGTITDCYVEGGSVSGEHDVGGLVGDNSGTITNCYSTGSVSGTTDVGGLVGLNTYWWFDLHVGIGTISNCYSTGSVSGVDQVGGLVGGNYGTISYSYSTGSVLGTGAVGGLVGYDNQGEVSASFWDVNTSGQASSVGGTGLPTADMQMQITFIDAGWDFNTPIWKMNCEGMSYPKLSWWQPMPGDFGCPDGVNFVDFSFFAEHWAEDNCGASNDCDGRDLDQLGSVDIKDLKIFADNWLAGF